ncbi:hypothetical protein JCM11641_005005 [Rhodosporidiobolus odoratus]
MSIWHPSMYGVGPNFAYNVGDPVAPIGPDLPKQADWWFRGPAVMALPPQDGAVMELPAGGKVDVEIACNVAWTSYGERTTEETEELSACPSNYGAYHSGDPAGPIDEHFISGCALGIADVDDINEVTMDNLAIFSVQQQCVKQRVTIFEVPAQMPPCTGKKCICSWMWLANTGTANFYMTPFDCSVSGSPPNAKPIAAPQDPVYCGNDASKCTKGAKKPLYAYNSPTNVPGPVDNNRPGYHDSWSFSDGAQDDIFVAGVDTNGGRLSSLASSSTPSKASTRPAGSIEPSSQLSSHDNVTSVVSTRVHTLGHTLLPNTAALSVSLSVGVATLDAAAQTSLTSDSTSVPACSRATSHPSSLSSSTVDDDDNDESAVPTSVPTLPMSRFHHSRRPSPSSAAPSPLALDDQSSEFNLNYNGVTTTQSTQVAPTCSASLEINTDLELSPSPRSRWHRRQHHHGRHHYPTGDADRPRLPTSTGMGAAQIASNIASLTAAEGEAPDVEVTGDKLVKREMWVDEEVLKELTGNAVRGGPLTELCAVGLVLAASLVFS